MDQLLTFEHPCLSDIAYVASGTSTSSCYLGHFENFGFIDSVGEYCNFLSPS